MTRCLFLIEDWPITPVAAGGASALIYSHLELMARTVEHIDLVILVNPDNSLGFQSYTESQPEVWAQVSGWCKTVQTINIAQGAQKLSRLYRLSAGLLDPGLYSYGDLIQGECVKRLAQVIRSSSPDFIWVEHIIPASLVRKIAPACPVIYSHHDWRWKIKSHRLGAGARNLSQKINFWFSRRHEVKLVQALTGCVSGSITELEEMRTLGVRCLDYFPTTYAAVDLSTVIDDDHPRIVHLGGMQATANRLGLLRFMQICWPQLSSSLSPRPTLWVIGSLEGASPDLRAALDQENIICTGGVPDLLTVLRPFDIHIVPWEYNTGTRTRIPLVLNHTQVIVSTRAAASCLPELVHGENSILVETLPDMTKSIIALFEQSDLRKRIAHQGRETFLKSFTCEAQQPRFNKFIQTISQ